MDYDDTIEFGRPEPVLRHLFEEEIDGSAWQVSHHTNELETGTPADRRQPARVVIDTLWYWLTPDQAERMGRALLEASGKYSPKFRNSEDEGPIQRVIDIGD